MADKDVSYAAWVAAGRPGFSYDDWRWWQTGDTSDRKSEGDTHSPAYMRAHGQDPNATVSGSTAAPRSFEQRHAAGEFAGDKGVARDLEVRRRRRLDANAPAGVLSLPPDLADIALRDVATGRQRRARGGSTVSTLGYFNPTAPLMGVG